MIDFQKMTQELVRCARGSLTQSQLDQLLDLGQKKCSKWETGVHQIRWQEFATLCDVRELQAAKALDSLFAFRGDIQDTSQVMTALTAKYNLDQVAKTLKKSRPTLSRWLNGSIDPPLACILHLFSMHGVLIQFFDLTFGERISMPQIRKLEQFLDHFLTFQAKYPEAPLLLTIMESKSFLELKHYTRGWIASKIGVSPAREEILLKEMVQAKLIARTETSYVPLILVSDSSWSSAFSFEANKKMRNYWIHEASRLLSQSTFEDTKCRGGYLMYAVCEEDYNKIAAEAAAFYRRILAILENNNPADRTRVALVQYQLLNYI